VTIICDFVLYIAWYIEFAAFEHFLLKILMLMLIARFSAGSLRDVGKQAFYVFPAVLVLSHGRTE
jgi:hypothetical protein